MTEQAADPRIPAAADRARDACNTLTARVAVLIAHGRHHTNPTPRRPTDDEIAATANETPSPEPPPRAKSHRSDPTAAAAFAWAADVSRAITNLCDIADTAERACLAQGIPIVAPDRPAIEYDNRGNPIVSAQPSRAVRHTATFHHFIHACIDQLEAAVARLDDWEDGRWLALRLNGLASDLERAAGRQPRVATSGSKPRMCTDRHGYGCRRPVNTGTRTCDRCRQRAHRDRKAAAEQAHAS